MLVRHHSDMVQVRVVNATALLLMALMRCEQEHLVVGVQPLWLLWREMMNLFRHELANLVVSFVLLRISHAFVCVFLHIHTISGL